MPEVKILADQDIITYPDLMGPKVMRVLQYQIGDAPPRTIMVPKEEWQSKGTEKLIREDMAKAKTEGPRTITI